MGAVPTPTPSSLHSNPCRPTSIGPIQLTQQIGLCSFKALSSPFQQAPRATHIVQLSQQYTTNLIGKKVAKLTLEVSSTKGNKGGVYHQGCSAVSKMVPWASFMSFTASLGSSALHAVSPTSEKAEALSQAGRQQPLAGRQQLQSLA